MTELSDYQRIIEKPAIARYEARLDAAGKRIRELEADVQEAAIAALEAAALVADKAAKEAERVGLLHGENTDNRSRLFARSREATAIAERIRALIPKREVPAGDKAPCGECHLKPGETCDICGAFKA